MMSMQKSIVLTALCVAAALLLEDESIAVQGQACDPRVPLWERWRVSEPALNAAGAQIETGMLLIEIARSEIGQWPVRWKGAVRAQFDGSSLDMQQAPMSAVDQKVFLRDLTVADIAIGRLAEGECFSDVIKTMKASRTANYLSGPLLATTDGGEAQASRRIFGVFFTDGGSYPENGEWDSRIHLLASKTATDAVQVRIDALIDRDGWEPAEVPIRAAASIENGGVVVLAKIALPAPAAVWSEAWIEDLLQPEEESVLFLFVNPHLR